MFYLELIAPSYRGENLPSSLTNAPLMRGFSVFAKLNQQCSWFCVSSRYCYLQSCPLILSMASVFFLTCTNQYLSEDFKYSRSLSSLCSSPLQYCFGKFSQPWPPDSISSNQGEHQLCLKTFSRPSVWVSLYRTYLLISHLSGIPVVSCLMFNIFRIIVSVQVFSCFTCEAKFSTCHSSRLEADGPLMNLNNWKVDLGFSWIFFFLTWKVQSLGISFLAFQHMPFIYFSCLRVLLRPPVQNCEEVITSSVLLVFYCL